VKSAASFKGHPFHPMLVVFPLAFWVGSLAADLIYLWRDHPFWYRLSWYLIAGGVVGALAAAIPGVIDFFRSIPPFSGCKPLARRHGLLNGFLVVLYGFALWWRTRPGAEQGSDWWIALGLSVVGVALLSYSGWLGGHIVYNCEVGRQQTQVGNQPTISGPSLSGPPGEFVDVARGDELGVGQLKHVILNGAWIGLARTEQGYFAIDEICTHKGGPLCDGVLMGHTIQCPWHGSRFNIGTGAVEAGPAEEKINTFEVRVQGSTVAVRAPENAAAAAARARLV
jgi:uncharacterized membrane protein/nitrite reductase/ring-hydroxylating ferredoxin subunit